jgi:hypothetical protein
MLGIATSRQFGVPSTSADDGIGMLMIARRPDAAALRAADRFSAAKHADQRRNASRDELPGRRYDSFATKTFRLASGRLFLYEPRVARRREAPRREFLRLAGASGRRR